MARPQRVQIVPSQDRAKYQAWRSRVLSWTIPTDPPGARRLRDMPEAYQRSFLDHLLVAKAIRSEPDHWSRGLVDLGDDQ